MESKRWQFCKHAWGNWDTWFFLALFKTAKFRFFLRTDEKRPVETDEKWHWYVFSPNVWSLLKEKTKYSQKFVNLFIYIPTYPISSVILKQGNTATKCYQPMQANWTCVLRLHGLQSQGGVVHYTSFFTIRVHLQKIHSSPVLTVEADFDFKVLLPKHWSELGLPTAINRRLESINFSKTYAHS